MLFKRLRQNRERYKRLAHIIAGILILLHAFERFTSGHHTYVLFAVAGVIFLTVAALHSKIEHKAPWIDGVFFIIESCLSFVIAWEYFHAGKTGLPYCYLFTGILQLVLAVVMSKKGITAQRGASENSN